MKPKILILLVAFSFTSLLFAGTSLAYTQNTANNDNSFVPASIDIRLGDGNIVRNLEGPTAVDAYIRVMLVPTVQGDDGSELMGSVSISGSGIEITPPDGQPESFALASGWEDNWFCEDGIFYHKRIVKPGGQTSPLIESIDSGSGIQLEVLAQAVQTVNGAPGAVWGEGIQAQLIK